MPSEVAGSTVRAALEVMKDRYDSVLIGIFADDQPCEVNPPGERPISEGESLLVIRALPLDDSKAGRRLSWRSR